MKITGGKQLFYLLFMTILFGLSFIASKQALTGLGIFQLVFIRHLLALVVLFLFLWRDRPKWVIARRDVKHFLALTLVEPVAYFIFETFGIRYTSPSSVSIIIATIPIFSLLFGWWILQERTRLIAIAGILFSLLGVYFIVSYQQPTDLAPRPVLGNVLALGAAVSAGLYNVLCRRLTRTYSAWTVTLYQSLVATVVFLPLAIGEEYWTSGAHIDGKVLISVLYLGLGSSVLAYYLLNTSLSRLPAYKVAVFSNLIPVVTIVASWFIFSEVLGVSRWLGALLITAGIYLTYFRSGQRSGLPDQ